VTSALGALLGTLLSSLLLTMHPTAAVAATTPAPTTTPVQATVPTARTVWIDASVGRSWPVAATVRDIDRYTGTVARLGRCHAGSACVVIRESRTLPLAWPAATYPAGSKSTIKLNARRTISSSRDRYHILLHELGHAFGIYTHDRTCTSAMYSYVRCPGNRYAPNSFTSAQRAILRKH
jgi:hypothetical protein